MVRGRLFNDLGRRLCRALVVAGNRSSGVGGKQRCNAWRTVSKPGRSLAWLTIADKERISTAARTSNWIKRSPETEPRCMDQPKACTKLCTAHRETSLHDSVY